MFGVGDTLYQRHFIKRMAEIKGEIALATGWPQFFRDMPNVHYWFRDFWLLRTQDRNIQELLDKKLIVSREHKKATVDLNIQYDNRHLQEGETMPSSFAKGIENQVGIKIEDYTLDLPLRPEWVANAKRLIGGRRVAVIRPPTLRKEWRADARNPKIGVITKIVKELPKDVFKITIGYNEKNEEWNIEPIKADKSFENGELDLGTLAALINQAAITIGPVGFLVPMSVAVRGKALIIWGGHVKAAHLLDPRMDLKNFRYIEPNPGHNCFENQCESCNKEVDVDRGIAYMKDLLNAN